MEVWKYCKSVCRTLFVLLIGFLALPFVILFVCVSVPNLIFRSMISIFSGYLVADLAKMVSAIGHFFAVEGMTQKGSRCVIALTVLFEGTLTLEKVQDLWFSRVVNARCSADRLKYPELQSYITTFAFFKFWKVDTFFDVRNHIKRYQLPRLVEKAFSFDESDLQQIHEYLHNEPFQSKRSPWEIMIVGNFRHFPTTAAAAAEIEDASVGLETSEESGKPLTLVAFRFHHVLADGYSLQRLFVEGIFGKNVRALQSPNPSFIAGDDKRKSCEKLVEALLIPFSMFYEASLFLEMGLQRNVPWIVKEREKMWRQVVGLTPMIPVNCIRDIKNCHKVSFTSVLVSAITGAVRNLLTTKTQNPALNELGIPVVFALPIGNHPDKLTNQFTFGFTNIPIHEGDPLLRLKRCHEIVEHAKASTGPILGRCLMILAGSMAYPIVKLITINRIIPIIISNFPISGIQLSLPDHACLEICGSVGPGRGAAGVLFSMMTYGNFIRFSATAEQSLLSHEDVNQLVMFINEEIRILHQTTHVS